MMTKKLPRRYRCPVKMWVESGFMRKGLGPKFFFLNRDESLVRLAKAFAPKDMCLVFEYE